MWKICIINLFFFFKMCTIGLKTRTEWLVCDNSVLIHGYLDLIKIPNGKIIFKHEMGVTKLNTDIGKSTSSRIFGYQGYWIN